MTNDGWFLLSRKEDDLYFDEKFTRWQSWQDLIRLACWKEYRSHIRGIPIDHKVGCVYESTENLARRWGWSRGKVIRFLKELEMDERIIQQKSNVINCISIINYAKYQLNDTTDRTTDRTTNDTTNGTTQKEKKIKENKYNSSSTTGTPMKNFVKVEDLSIWLANRDDGWKEVTAMNLQITLGQLSVEFVRYQSELISQGVTEKDEGDICRHFVNQTRVRLRAERKDKRSSAKPNAFSSDEMDYTKGFAQL